MTLPLPQVGRHWDHGVERRRPSRRSRARSHSDELACVPLSPHRGLKGQGSIVQSNQLHQPRHHNVGCLMAPGTVPLGACFGSSLQNRGEYCRRLLLIERSVVITWLARCILPRWVCECVGTCWRVLVCCGLWSTGTFCSVTCCISVLLCEYNTLQYGSQMRLCNTLPSSLIHSTRVLQSPT